MTNGYLILAGLGLALVGLALIWWPLALIAGGGMLFAGGLLAEVAEARHRPPEGDDS